MMFNKLMLLTSSEVGRVRDLDLLSALVRGADLSRSVIRSRGVLDVLDHATPEIGVGGKFALDLTTTTPDTECDFDNEYERWSVEVCYHEIGKKLDVEQLVATAQRKYIVVVEPSASGLSPEELLWFVAGNIEADRDIIVKDNHLVIDGRSKRAGVEGMPSRWPNPVTSSLSTIELVDSRWAEYGLGEYLASPSLHYLPLCDREGAER